MENVKRGKTMESICEIPGISAAPEAIECRRREPSA
jgi:hypothetical protein